MRRALVIAASLLLLAAASSAYLLLGPKGDSATKRASATPPALANVPVPQPTRTPHFYPPGIVPSIDYGPIALPSPDQPCPVSQIRPPGHDLPNGIGQVAIGDGPLFLGRASPIPLRSGRPEVVRVAMASTHSGAFMLRGAGADVPSDLWFGNDPGAAAPFPTLIYNQGAPGPPPQRGVLSWWLMAAAPAVPQGVTWRVYSLAILAPEPGCYVVQVDGQPPMAEQIVLAVN